MKTIRTKSMTAISMFAVLAMVSCGDKPAPDPGPGGGGEPTPPALEPTFTNFQPLTGQSGTKFYIVGENFDTAAQVKVWFDDIELPDAKIMNDKRIDVTLPQIVGGIYKVKVRIGDNDAYTFEKGFLYPLSFSEVSTFAGIQASAGGENGNAATATFTRPYILAYDKVDNAIFVHEDHEAAGKKLRRIKNGQVETLLDYTATDLVVDGKAKANNLRSISFSPDCNTLYFANDGGGATPTVNGAIFIAKREDDFKKLYAVVGYDPEKGIPVSAGKHFNFAAAHPITGKLYMWSWHRAVYSWDLTDGGESVKQVADLAGDIPGNGSGNYGSLSFSLDGTKIYVVGRNQSAVIFVADYDIEADEVSGSFRLFAGSPLPGAQGQGNVDGQGGEARFSEPFHMMPGADGYLYLPQLRTWSIHKISPEANAVKLTGTGAAGYVDGPLDVAAFDAPGSVVFDNDRNMYVADMYNHVIRKLTSVKE